MNAHIFEPDHATLRTFVSAIAALSDEALVHATRDGFYVRSVDPAHVAMIEARIGKDAFRKIVIENGEEVIFGLDVTILQSVLKSFREQDDVSIIVYDKSIAVRSSGIRRTFVRLDADLLHESKLPNLEDGFKSFGALKTSDLLRALKSASDVSDAVFLIATKDGFRLNTHPDAEETCEATFDASDINAFKCANDETKSQFPIDYFVNIVRQCKSSRVYLAIGNDFPCKIEWAIGMRGVDHGIGQATYLLAPRIESP